jgi:hypothetical protein
MSRPLAFVSVLVAAFFVLMGALGLFAGIASAFPTTEEAFFKIGPMPELSGAVLIVVGAVFLVAGYVLNRFAGKTSR